MAKSQFFCLALVSLALFLSPIKAEEEEEEAAAPSDIHFLGDDNFETEIKNIKYALVMFHAPWCGHCVRLAPEFAKAATILKDDSPNAVTLIKVDCTEAGKLTCGANGVRGYPTLKIFRDGEIASEYKGPRDVDGIVKYMRTEIEALNAAPAIKPAPAAAAEKTAPKATEEAEAPSDVIILRDDDFDEKIKTFENALVMFHAPWCGHCKRLAPEYVKAAAIMKDDSPHAVTLVKVDCTEAGKSTCGDNGVRGYPTLKIFKNGEIATDYRGPRDVDGIVKYLRKEVAALHAPQKAADEKAEL